MSLKIDLVELKNAVQPVHIPSRRMEINTTDLLTVFSCNEGDKFENFKVTNQYLILLFISMGLQINMN